MEQGWMTADHYLMHAIDEIDKRLGEGFAKKHPELLAAFIQTAAIDAGSCFIARAIEILANAVSEK
jgi:hypothetical protein